MTKKNCGNCKWHEDFTGACFNGDSPYCANFTSEEQDCKAFEEKERKDGEQ